MCGLGWSRCKRMRFPPRKRVPAHGHRLLACECWITAVPVQCESLGCGATLVFRVPRSCLWRRTGQERCWEGSRVGTRQRGLWLGVVQLIWQYQRLKLNLRHYPVIYHSSFSTGVCCHWFIASPEHFLCKWDDDRVCSTTMYYWGTLRWSLDEVSVSESTQKSCGFFPCLLPARNSAFSCWVDLI